MGAFAIQGGPRRTAARPDAERGRGTPTPSLTPRTRRTRRALRPRPRRSPRIAPVVAALCAATLVPLAGAHATERVTVERIAGPTRIETAAAVSDATFPVGLAGDRSAGGDQAAPPAVNAILARDDAFPDAMVGSFLANEFQAPILLTGRDRLPEATRRQLERLGTERVFVLGGVAAIGAAVEAELVALGYDTTRIAGATREDTAAAVATFPDASDVGTLGTSGRTAILTRRDTFADALSGGAVASDGSFAHLLTTTDALSPAAARALEELGIEHVVIVGGAAAITPGVEAQIRDRGITTQRVAGPNRMRTAIELAGFGRSQLGMALDEVVLSRGDTFPDALSAGPFAGFTGLPILLTAGPDDLSDDVHDFLDDNDDLIRRITVLGGRRAVTDAVAAQAQQAATTS